MFVDRCQCCAAIVVGCWLLRAGCCLLVVVWWLVACRWLLFVVGCVCLVLLLHVVGCCMLSVVRWTCSLLSLVAVAVVSYVLCVVRCVMFAVGLLLVVGCC